MSDLVLDASAIINAAIPESGFRFYAPYRLHAPGLLWWEVNSVLHEQVWRGNLSSLNATNAMQRFHSQRIHRMEPEPKFLQAASQLARRLGWAKVYDATYVALALDIEGSRLVTIDERLRRGVSRIVDVIGPTEV